VVACSQRFSNGTASIAICKGADLQVATEGDAVDEAPSWLPGKDRQLVFQSAGIARNAASTSMPPKVKRAQSSH
jgi:hypothetical protein